MGQSLKIGGEFGHLQIRGPLGGASEDQVRFDDGIFAQFFQQPPPIDGTTGAADTDYDFQELLLAGQVVLISEQTLDLCSECPV